MLLRVVLLPLVLILLFHPPQSLGAENPFLDGYRAYIRGDYREALELFKAVRAGSPLYEYALYFRSESFFRIGEYEKAREGFEAFLNRYLKSALRLEAILRLAEILISEGRYGKASTILQGILDERRDGKALYLLGKAFEGMDNLKEAFRTYLTLWRDHPEEAEGVEEELDRLQSQGYRITPSDRLKRVENLYLAMQHSPGKWKIKQQALREVRSINPEGLDGEGLLTLAKLAYRLGDLKKAERILKGLSLRVDGGLRGEVLYYLAMVCLKKGDRGCAVKDLNILVDIPSYADKALYHLALIEKGKGRVREAISLLGRAYRDHPESPLRSEILWNLAWFNYLLRRYGEAESYLLLLKEGPSSFRERALYWLGRIALLKGNRKGVKILRDLAGAEDPSYYSFMAQKTLQEMGEVVPRSRYLGGDGVFLSPDRFPSFAKVKSLLDLGLYDLAKREIKNTLERIEDPVQILIGASLLQKAGDYYGALNLGESYIRKDVDGSMKLYFLRLAYPQGYKEIVLKKGESLGLDPLLIYGIIREESSFHPDTVSVAHATGLMQIIPATGRYLAERFGYRDFDVSTLFNPQDNIDLGMGYIKMLLESFKGNIFLALAAYNGGPANVRKWLKKREGFRMDEFVEDIPFDETRRYIKKVIRSYYIYTLLYSGQDGR